jgi:UDP-N-acetylmuramate--alanine ligase
MLQCFGYRYQYIKETLEKYKGTQRRFDVLGETQSGIRIVDDYAHHPAEIRATIEAAINTPHKNIWCLFQPHTYTRTLALFDEFPASFERRIRWCWQRYMRQRKKCLSNKLKGSDG